MHQTTKKHSPSLYGSEQHRRFASHSLQCTNVRRRAGNCWQRIKVIQIWKLNDHTHAVHTLYWCLYIAISSKVSIDRSSQSNCCCTRINLLYCLSSTVCIFLLRDHRSECTLWLAQCRFLIRFTPCKTSTPFHEGNGFSLMEHPSHVLTMYTHTKNEYESNEQWNHNSILLALFCWPQQG